MKNDVTLLVVDKNPNVRHFIGRELSGSGFRVILSESAKVAIEAVNKNSSIRLVVLDPDLPDGDKYRILDFLSLRKPQIPVIIHTFTSIFNGCGMLPAQSVFIEKQGNSIDHIVRTISNLVSKNPPARATR